MRVGRRMHTQHDRCSFFGLAILWLSLWGSTVTINVKWFCFLANFAGAFNPSEPIGQQPIPQTTELN
jgi:hypothetical protein